MSKNINNRPLISIVVVTYNHEKFIREAIDSFLAQETNFDFEIVIGDDASTDDTQKILKEYDLKYPNKFTVFYREKNIGMMPNFISVLKACKGKYLAFCDGDDYWVETSKLQQQVDFLEQNSSYGICFHNVMMFDEPTKTLKEDYITKSSKDTFDIKNLASGNFMHTPSVVIRNDFELPSWFSSSPIGDWPLFLLQVGDRKIKKLDDKMAVYRVHQSGVWSTKDEEFRISETIKVIDFLLSNLNLPTAVKKILEKSKRKMNKRLGIKETSFYSKLLNLVKRK